MINDKTVNGFMKAMYKIPTTETLQVEAYALLQSVSGPEGLKDGGQATSGTKPKAPKAF